MIVSQALWRGVWIIGLLGFVAVFLAGMLAVGSFAIGSEPGVLSEGGPFSKIVGVWGFRVYLICGLLLLVPAFLHLAKSRETISSLRRILWTFLLLIFFAVAPYVYFAIYMRAKEANL